MADEDGTKPLSPYRILQDLFAPNKFLTNSSDNEDDKLPSWREDVDASSNDRKSEEYGDYSTLLKQDPCDSSSGATEIVGGGIEDSVENDSEYSVQLDHFASKSDNSVTLDGPNRTFKLQGEIAAMLLEHQRDGLKWLWSLHCQGKGGILGDDMGLGKTRQICSFLAGLFHSRLIKRALVVAPKTLLPHWIKELSAVGLSEKTRVYHGTFKKAQEEGLNCIHQEEGVIVTTYGMVRDYSKSLSELRHLRSYVEKSRDSPKWPDYLILDEGHQIKNPNTQKAQTLQEIPCLHRLALSGTPWQNNLKEMWALFNFCNPGLLGDYEWFKENFETHISYGRDKRATRKYKRLSSSVAKELRDLIQPYFLRRTKSEVVGAKISNKHEIVVWLRLTNIQRHLYKEFLRTVNNKTWVYGEPFAALKIMRKICDHPLLLSKPDLSKGKYKKLLHIEEANLVDKLELHMKDVWNTYNFKVEHEISFKLSFIMPLLGNLIPQGHHVLIFSGSLRMLDLIQESLLSKGYKLLRIDGTTKAEDRTKIVDDFQQHAVAPIFLLSSKVGGLGLTLTRADRVIVTDPDWNPSTDDQIVDRACRIGQTKVVVAYRLITCGTLEEKAYRKQVFKDGLCKTGTEHKEKARHFSWNDHRYPFTPPKKGFDVSVTQQQLEKKYDWEETMDESFKEHIDFLRSLGIAGVSHHNVLLSLEASDDEDDPENYEATRALSAFYSKRAKWRSKSSYPNSLGKLSELFARKTVQAKLAEMRNKANHNVMGTGYRKLEWNDVRFAQESNEWKHRHQRQKTFQAELRNMVQESKHKYHSQLDEELSPHGVAISLPTCSQNQIKHSQCQPQKSNESFTSRLINRAKRLFKILR